MTAKLGYTACTGNCNAVVLGGRTNHEFESFGFMEFTSAMTSPDSAYNSMQKKP